MRQKQARTAAIAFYEPKIKAANAQIAAIENNETALENRVSKFTRLSGYEGDEPSCSHTHLPGCGHWCRYYARQASSARAALERARPENEKTIAGLRKNIAAWKADKANEIQNRVRALHGDRDLLARVRRCLRSRSSTRRCGSTSSSSSACSSASISWRW